MERGQRKLVEYVLVTAFLVIAAAGAVAIFGDELRAALGLSSPGGSASTPPAPSLSRGSGGAASPTPAAGP